jgi:uracil-DNA glycosylase
MLALGAIAHRAALRALGVKPGGYPFAHGAVHRPPGAPIVVDSYHCSRYNTQTRRLTAQMFADVLAEARALATER